MFFNPTQFLYNAVDKVLDLSVVRIKGDMKDRSKFPVTWYLTASDIDAKFSDLTIDFGLKDSILYQYFKQPN